MTKTRVPAIPAPTEANLREVARALKVLADIREGVTGDPLDRFVTFRDLDDGGVASVSLSGGRVSGIRPSAPIAGPGYDPTADLTTPPQPTGVTATGAFASVILSWDGLPAGYINHAYAEIWRADTNVVGDSVLIGTTLSTSFVDFIGNSATRYYWVRFVSQANVIGAYHDISGAVGTTSEDPELLLDALTGQITESQLFEDLGARINLIDDPATGLVAQVENVKGKYTVKIDNAGHISGYGLASTANDATPTSEFGVRADKFWIAGASTASSTEPTTDLYKGRVWLDTSVTPNVTRYYTGSAWSTTPQSNVFAVLNAPGTINGVSVPAGVYIDTAFVADATITRAKIADLAVDDAKIADLTVAKLTGGEMKVGSFIQSTNYTSGASGNGWRINADGTAELQAAFIRGQLVAGQLAADSVETNTIKGGAVSKVVEYTWTWSGTSGDETFVRYLNMPFGGTVHYILVTQIFSTGLSEDDTMASDIHFNGVMLDGITGTFNAAGFPVVLITSVVVSSQGTVNYGGRLRWNNIAGGQARARALVLVTYR